jgi:D-3-phosphoglycerate dehydrogenase
VVGRAGTGVDNIDVGAATRRGVVVMNTPGGNAVAACEHTFALLLALLRNVPAAVADLSGGGWNRTRFRGHQLAGRTMGLLGFGRIGREVAIRARAFGMELLVCDPFVKETLVREWEGRLVDRETLLGASDVVSLHLPLTSETRHLIDASALGRMKPDAVLVNCARGGLVDEDALLAALEAGRLGGAALDVFETEPPVGSPLLEHPRVVATPHLGASTEEAQRGVARAISEQVRDFLLRGEVRHAVNMPSMSADLHELVRPYLDLGERLGGMAAQIGGAPVRRLEVTLLGECTELPRAPLVAAALVGVFRASPGGDFVNYVNARMAASELGIQVEEKARQDAGEHAGLLEVTVEGDGGGARVAGWITPAGTPRLARWEGLTVDAVPEGEILFLRNPDVPGVVGAIGTLLGDAGLNIAHITWGRDPGAEEAYTVINLDGSVSTDMLDRIRAHAKVRWAEVVRLP